MTLLQIFYYISIEINEYNNFKYFYFDSKTNPGSKLAICMVLIFVIYAPVIFNFITFLLFKNCIKEYYHTTMDHN